MIPVSPLSQTTAVSPHSRALCHRPGLSFLGVGGMKLPSPELTELCSEQQPGEEDAVGAFQHRVATNQLPLTLAKLQ